MEAAIKKAKAESNIVAAFDKAGFETRAEYFDHKEGYLDSLVATAIRLKNSHSKTK